MYSELDTVALDRDIGEYGLKKGDIGGIVHCYEHGNAFEVEFVNGEGKTVALLTLTKHEIRSIGGKEILHARELEEIIA